MSFAADGTRFIGVHMTVRFCISINPAFKVSQNDLGRRMADQVLRHDWYFAASAGGINTESWHPETGGVTPKIFNYFNASRYRGAKMLDTLGKVALVEIVRANPDF